MKAKILSESPLMMSEVKQVLEKSKEKEELNFRAAKTLDYLSNVPVLDIKVAKKLKEELMALNVARLKDQHIAKLIDLLPTNAEDVRVLLQSYTISVSPENRAKIAEAIVAVNK